MNWSNVFKIMAITYLSSGKIRLNAYGIIMQFDTKEQLKAYLTSINN